MGCLPDFSVYRRAATVCCGRRLRRPLPAWTRSAPELGAARVYDTWSLGYERDGVNQNGELQERTSVRPEAELIDEGVNGLDDDGTAPDGLVDEAAERETQPPYDHALRGIEVRIRKIDVESRQVRQVSVVGDFTD